MYALTIKNPHAYNILYSGKDVESRTWKLPLNYQGVWIALHAAKTYDKSWPIVTIPKDYYGAIIGFVKFSDCVENSDSKWAIPGQYHWLISETTTLSNPIPCKGALGFWRYL